MCSRREEKTNKNKLKLLKFLTSLVILTQKMKMLRMCLQGLLLLLKSLSLTSNLDFRIITLLPIETTVNSQVHLSIQLRSCKKIIGI